MDDCFTLAYTTVMVYIHKKLCGVCVLSAGALLLVAGALVWYVFFKA